MRSNRGGVLSAALAFAFSGGMNFQVQPETPRLSMKDYDDLGFRNKRHPRNKSSAINQRQIRKNNRRRHAAGFKNAFK